ncbi:hypothetical protein AHFPHNDE_03466 [Pseudomonas sp. MM227]|uniref:RNA-directed DNA polymerase n=1 Tax=unclassified Pseudomonas TaxID=196821 RepID=UPI0017826E0A|nr:MULTISPECIES: RNA-directed DNA polymerase [unclassified Pseudomonas]MBD8683390.1 RNA-directed DNA polymerase [Pseudomonas sp. CFBP 13719]MBP1118722.1 hypothetical protein [Pseudomonas sp. PvP028]CAI3789762.1 hypothetical protein AHFPHNDE_03466 [Pseudomonas sp. MM227]
MVDQSSIPEDANSLIKKIDDLISSIANNDSLVRGKSVRSKLSKLVDECNARHLRAKTKIESFELLAFTINTEAVLQHLNQDMRSDWFVDAIQHRDLFENKSSLSDTLRMLLSADNGRYLGGDRKIYDIPKKGLGIRYSLETDFYDRFIYQAICSYLMPFFDPLLSHRVLSHRYNKHRTSERYIFKSRIELWKTFEGVTKTALKNNQSLLVTDLLNYYENITVASIKSAFEELLPKVNATGPEKSLIRNAIHTLCELLARWSYDDLHGLPQNRDASSFVANIVLNSVDQAMVTMGHDYYRYVDDIRIICTSPRSAKKVLTELISQLRTVGMNINSGKTIILTKDNSDTEIAEHFPTTDDRTMTIDTMWRSRSRRVIARSAKYIYDLLKECIDNRQTQSRQFRFAVNRLIQLAESNLFDVHNSVATDLKKLLIETLEEHAASTDQYCRILGVLALNENDLDQISQHLSDYEKSIHSWQNFHLWLLLSKKLYKSESLIELALDRIRLDLLQPEIPAIFIYLRCVGKSVLLVPLIERFSSAWPYYHQRNFLLATSDLDRDTLKPLIPELSIKLKGTVDRARSHYNNGLPLLDREPRSPLDLYEEITPYD